MKKSRKVSDPTEAIHLTEIPSIGMKAEEDLRLIGILKPIDLIKKDPFKLYVNLCLELNEYVDPCVLDQFMCAVSFMSGKGTKQWWEFTTERKKKFHKIEEEIKDLKKNTAPNPLKKRIK